LTVSRQRGYTEPGPDLETS